MEEPKSLPPTETAIGSPIPPRNYQGNKYDIYALVAGTLGGTVLAMCGTGNLLWYCLPIAPLVLGIIALANSRSSLDPQRTRNLAWIGIAGGGLGTLVLLCFIAFFALYFSFIIAAIAASLQSVPRR